jgi:hypothetical protein
MEFVDPQQNAFSLVSPELWLELEGPRRFPKQMDMFAEGTAQTDYSTRSITTPCDGTLTVYSAPALAISR